MQKTIERYGACFNLTLSVSKEAERPQLEAEVNRLFNYGIISNVPDDYDAGKDNFVMVQTDAGRLERGMYSLAIANARRDPKILRRFKGRAIVAWAKSKARAYVERFTAVATVQDNPYIRPPKIYSESGNPLELGWTQEFSA